MADLARIPPELQVPTPTPKPKLSKTFKMDGILSWSLRAVLDCPGAKTNGVLCEICSVCYAMEGRYPLPNVKAVREHNREDWKRDDWVPDMVFLLREQRHFRWFDSGDVVNARLARKIKAVIERTPWCKHWIPTRSHKVPEIRAVLETINKLSNACVRYSADKLDQYTPGLHGSVVVSNPEILPTGATLCRAEEQDPARCDGCRACWDKSVAVIAYEGHGRKIQQIINIQELTRSSPSTIPGRVAA